MTYQVWFEGGALVQLRGLPAVAFEALVERVVMLVEEPWDARVLPPGDDPALRMAVFAGYGLVSFHVDDVAQVVRVFDITWAG